MSALRLNGWEQLIQEARSYPYSPSRLAPRLAAALSVAIAEVERLTQERDTARDIAVALEQELVLKDQALDEIKEQARRWLKIASTAGGPEDVAYNEGLRDCQGDISRILTRLDTQGETK